MPLTIDINPQLDIFRDAAKKSKAYDMDETLVKATISNFTKYMDELIPVLAGGTPGTPMAVDLTRFQTAARGIQVISNLPIVMVVDFGDGNGAREIPLDKATASTTSTVTYCRATLEVASIASLSFRNDQGAGNDAEVQFAIWGD
jgi:hypothetical protein